MYKLLILVAFLLSGCENEFSMNLDRYDCKDVQTKVTEEISYCVKYNGSSRINFNNCQSYAIRTYCRLIPLVEGKEVK